MSVAQHGVHADPAKNARGFPGNPATPRPRKESGAGESPAKKRGTGGAGKRRDLREPLADYFKVNEYKITTRKRNDCFLDTKCKMNVVVKAVYRIGLRRASDVASNSRNSSCRINRIRPSKVSYVLRKGLGREGIPRR